MSATVHTESAALPRGALHVAFILTMPNNNAWNGRWSGEGNFYARVRSFTSRPFKEKALGLKRNYYYNFGDGWGANVEVKVITGDEKRQITRNSKGFCGYEWMIDSILNWGRILAEPPTVALSDETVSEGK